MFNVLIADDETSLFQSMKDAINWEELGLNLAIYVNSGKKAVDVILNSEIDIAILDIRMPELNGLEVCEIVRRENLNVQIIIVSGYAEFSYAEKAIGYGVLGYCLKPVEYDKVTRLLLKAKNKLMENSLHLSSSELVNALEYNDLVLVKNILRKLGFRNDSYYIAVTVGKEKLNINEEISFVLELGREQYGYILSNSPEKHKLEYWEENPNNLGIGLLKNKIELKDLNTSLLKCSQQAHQYFIDANAKITYKQNDDKANDILSNISNNIKKKQWDIVCKQLINIEKKSKNYFSIRTALKLYNMVYTSDFFKQEGNDNYMYGIKQLILEYNNFSEMLSILYSEIQKINKYKEDVNTFTNEAFLKLMNYINSEYRENISLTKAGEVLHMNPNYVSQLFKRGAGITFVQYITQLRMDEAIQLLLTTQKTVAEISDDVGVNDYFYFLKLFKKYTGKTPSQYREEN
ncbi:MAG: helix-turn-helix domain-containing protein [Lachnospirales bacterium]